MRKILILLSAFLISNCTSAKITSTPMAEQIIVDGNPVDWENYPAEYNEDWKIVYGVVHSESRLFLTLRFNDAPLARRLARRGFILWLDKEKKMGLKYKDDNLTAGLGSEPQYVYNSQGLFSITSQDSLPNTDISTYAEINARFEVAKGLFCFEYMLPLRNNNNLKLGFEIASISEKERQEMRGRMAGRGREEGLSGRSGGRPEGMRGRKPQGSSSERRPPNMEAQEIWFEVEIPR